MERIEMVEKLMSKANVGYEEAKEALEKLNWDLLEAMVYLEKEGKVKKEEEKRNVVLSKDTNGGNESNNGKDKNCGGVGSMFGRVCAFIKKLVKKGNRNYFEITKEEEKPIKISLTISTILAVLAFWPVAILLIIGLFLGYKYSLTGEDIKGKGVNNIFEKASESAETIKKDFDKEYNS